MGIKFLCPNGHKLHVKSFLSGKKAICPKCGARVIVPSDPGASDDTLDITTASVDLATVDSETLAEAVRAHVAANPETAATRPEPVSVPQAKAEPSPASDAIAEAPGAVWYVRPVSGGQFGPASGDIMRGWVKDNRVGAGSLVWRAGWTEWRSAAEVFPQLRNMLAAPGAPLPVVPLATSGAQLPPPAPSEVTGGELLSPTLRKRRRRNEVSLMASGILVAVSVVLFIVLLVVFRAQSTPAETPPADSAAAQG